MPERNLHPIQLPSESTPMLSSNLLGFAGQRNIVPEDIHCMLQHLPFSVLRWVGRAVSLSVQTRGSWQSLPALKKYRSIHDLKFLTSCENHYQRLSIALKFDPGSPVF